MICRSDWGHLNDPLSSWSSCDWFETPDTPVMNLLPSPSRWGSSPQLEVTYGETRKRT